MNKTGPIVLIEDDEDDKSIFADIFQNLGFKNEIVFFEDGEQALTYLIDTNNKPFLILSDMNMPKLNGLELKEKIHNNEDLRLRCIPYLFFTTSASQQAVVDAYSKSVQGFFVKPNNMKELESTIRKIIEYWSECMSPNYIK